MFIADFEQARATGQCVRNQIGFMAQTERAPVIRAELERGGGIENVVGRKIARCTTALRVSTFPKE